ncbi:hypothetical protein HAX54_006834, partial [Datura stramonium]|nr:hypothetical protein [Datura stramonium]
NTEKGVFLCVVSGKECDIDRGKFEVEEDHLCQLVFYVQKLGEDVDHLLLHCKVVKRLWQVILKLFGKQRVIPNTDKEALQNWTQMRERSPRAWSMAPLKSCGLSGKRNTRTIERVEQDLIRLGAYIWNPLGEDYLLECAWQDTEWVDQKLT